MKILIISDTHRKNEDFEKVLKATGPIDLLVHCGDVEGGEYYFSKAVDCPSYIVQGNNDYFSPLSPEVLFDAEGYRIWVTHGHKHFVSINRAFLVEEAKDRQANIVFFGHTHCPVVECVDGIWLVNPGSLSYPRQEGRRYTYAVAELNSESEPTITIHSL